MDPASIEKASKFWSQAFLRPKTGHEDPMACLICGPFVNHERQASDLTGVAGHSVFRRRWLERTMHCTGHLFLSSRGRSSYLKYRIPFTQHATLLYPHSWIFLVNPRTVFLMIKTFLGLVRRLINPEKLATLSWYFFSYIYANQRHSGVAIDNIHWRSPSMFGASFIRYWDQIYLALMERQILCCSPSLGTAEDRTRGGRWLSAQCDTHLIHTCHPHECTWPGVYSYLFICQNAAVSCGFR